MEYHMEHCESNQGLTACQPMGIYLSAYGYLPVS